MPRPCFALMCAAAGSARASEKTERRGVRERQEDANAGQDGRGAPVAARDLSAQPRHRERRVLQVGRDPGVSSKLALAGGPCAGVLPVRSSWGAASAGLVL